MRARGSEFILTPTKETKKHDLTQGEHFQLTPYRPLLSAQHHHGDWREFAAKSGEILHRFQQFGELNLHPTQLRELLRSLRLARLGAGPVRTPASSSIAKVRQIQ